MSDTPPTYQEFVDEFCRCRLTMEQARSCIQLCHDNLQPGKNHTSAVMKQLRLREQAITALLERSR